MLTVMFCATDGTSRTWASQTRNLSMKHETSQKDYML